MGKSSLITVSVVVLLLGLWAFTLVKRPPLPAASPDPSSAVGAAQPDARDREIAELKDRLSKLEASEQRAKNEQRLPKTAAENAPAAEARDPAVLKREQEIADWMNDHYTPEVQANVFGMYFADVDRLRTAEKPDAEWARSVDQGLRSLLAVGKPTIGVSTIERLECGATLCRIRINVEKPNERGRLIHAMQQNLQLEEASVLTPAEGTFLEGYFARAGATLPQFDQIKYVGAEMDRL